MLVLGVLTVGVLIASAVASTGPDSGPFRSLRHVAVVGYAVALVFAVLLVVTLLWRSQGSGAR